MPLIASTLTNANKFRAMFGMGTNSTWTTISENAIISRNGNANIILEYTGMKGTIAVKQADVVLDTFPLSYQVNYTPQDSFDDLNYYAAKAVTRRTWDDFCNLLDCGKPGVPFWLFILYLSAILFSTIRSGHRGSNSQSRSMRTIIPMEAPTPRFHF